MEDKSTEPKARTSQPTPTASLAYARLPSVGKNDHRDKTHIADFSDEELDALVEGSLSLCVEAELKMRLARYQLAMAQEELDWRRLGKPKHSTEYWEKYWNNETEEAAKACGVDLGYVAEIALRLSKET